MAGCWPMRSSETCWIETAFVRASCPDPGARATSLPQVGLSNDRYGRDVLDPRAARNRRPQTKDIPMRLGMVVEDPGSGFVGDHGLGERPGDPGGSPGKTTQLPGRPRVLARRQAGCAADSAPYRVHQALHHRLGRPGCAGKAKVALPSRIYVEGRHDAELVEKIWGGDLRHVGVVVEYLGGIDDLVAIVAEFQPRARTPARRAGRPSGQRQQGDPDRPAGRPRWLRRRRPDHRAPVHRHLAGDQT